MEVPTFFTKGFFFFAAAPRMKKDMFQNEQRDSDSELSQTYLARAQKTKLLVALCLWWHGAGQ